MFLQYFFINLHLFFIFFVKISFFRFSIRKNAPKRRLRDILLIKFFLHYTSIGCLGGIGNVDHRAIGAFLLLENVVKAFQLLFKILKRSKLHANGILKNAGERILVRKINVGDKLQNLGSL